MSNTRGFLDSPFDEDDDGEFSDPYIVVATFRAQFSGVCTVDDSHYYKTRDIVGKVERTDNPFIPVPGVCCNRCVRDLVHKKSVV